MKKTRRIVFLLSVFVLAFALLCPSALAKTNIKIVVDAQNVAFTDAEPFIDQNGRTQVPMRALGEALGCNVDYVKTTEPNGFFDTRIFVSKKTTDGKVWQAQFFGPFYDIDGYFGNWQNRLSLTVETAVVDYPNTYKEVTMDTAPTEINDRTYLPARYIAEAFGYNVLWDAAGNTVNIVGNSEAVFNEKPYEMPKNSMDAVCGNWSLVNNQTGDAANLKITNDKVIYTVNGQNRIYQIKNAQFDRDTASCSLSLQKGNMSTSLNLLIYGCGDHALCFHRMEQSGEFFGLTCFTAYYISQDENF